jgi:hypothetical protein
MSVSHSHNQGKEEEEIFIAIMAKNWELFRHKSPNVWMPKSPSILKKFVFI